MTSNLKTAINLDNKKRLRDEEGTPQWLNRSSLFSHDLRIQENDLQLFDLLLKETEGICIYNLEQIKLDLEILIANLFLNSKPVAISLNRNNWKKDSSRRASAGTLKLIKSLVEKGYISIAKGYRTKTESRNTRIWPSEILRNYRSQYKKFIIYDPVQLVILRDRGTKTRIAFSKDLKTSKVVNGIEVVLRKVNRLNLESHITFKGKRINTSLIAIFIGNIELYGRFHTLGSNHYQGLSGDERKEILINEEVTVELDYSSLHPFMLYAMEGIQYKGDPYSVVNENPAARSFLKRILLYMINARDELTAERASNMWYRKESDIIELNKIGIYRARPLIDQIKLKHHKIAKYFCKGRDTGLKVMNKDAKIALRVIKHFANKEIPILAIHDSFIVQAKYEQELREVMAQAYTKETNGFVCSVK